MKRLPPFALVALIAAHHLASAAPAGVLLFAQEGTQIIDASGVARPAKRGDALQPGERLRTPPGGILQLRLPDGSLVGMRPGAELALGGPSTTPGSEGPAPFVALTQGAVRVIGAELMDPGKRSALVFKSGLATLNLRGADLETAVLQAGNQRSDQPGAAGSYSRLLIGSGTIGNGALEAPLAPRQVSFVGVPNVAPTVVASVAPTLFSPVAPVASRTLSTATSLTTPSAITTTPLAGDKLALSPITTTLQSPVTTTARTPLPTTVAPLPVTATLITPIATPVAPTPVAPTPIAIAPVIVSPITVTPITVITPPPPTKLPVLSCKILKTC